jgi:hypothetical protein
MIVLWYKNDMTVFSWNQITAFAAGSSPLPSVFSAGTALSVGSFDGPHKGHEELFEAVKSQKQLVPGLITFRKPLGRFKKNGTYSGDISTLQQRLEIFGQKGFAFVVLIDFSAEFSKMNGSDFLSVLVHGCNMKFIAEGQDFRCGYRGATGRSEIAAFAESNGVRAFFPVPVLVDRHRVSSSLVRQHIRSGNFIAVEKMLNHRYRLDCSGFGWKSACVSDGDVWCSVPVQSITQVLPKSGRYDVLLVLSESRPETGRATAVFDAHGIRSQLLVEPKILRLKVSQSVAPEKIQAVEFISG